MHLRLFVLIIFIFAIQSCTQVSQNTATIQGSFVGLRNTPLSIYQLLPQSRPLIDSVITDAKGSFKVTFEVPKTGFYILNKDQANEITLIISPGDEILISGKGIQMQASYAVEGSHESELYAEYSHFTARNLLIVDSLSALFAQKRSDPGFTEIKNQLDAAYISVFNSQKKAVEDFVLKNPGSLAALLAISNYFGPNPLLTEKSHPELFFKLDSSLMIAYPENSLVNEFHLRMLGLKAEIADMMEHERLLGNGMPAPEIELADAAGRVKKLSEMNGKLTLLYFWSSWNALSRQTNMFLSSLYTQYNDRGFEIFAVSLDSDRQLWRNACQLDRAYWVNVIDTVGLSSQYCKTYVVKAIPKTYLIGRDGKIIARDLNFNELKSKIKNNL